MINYTIQLLIRQNDVWVDKSEFVQFPISIKETLDDTLDLGEIVLNFTNDSTEYEAWSEVRLTVIANGIPNEYYMLVQKDSIEEQHKGMDSYWKHNITLIEATHKLSAVQINDFSITQPQTFAAQVGTAPRIDVENLPNQTDVLAGTGPRSFTDESKWREHGTITTGRLSYGLFGSGKYETKLYNFKINRPAFQPKIAYFTNQGFIQLPELPTGTFTVGFPARTDFGFGINWAYIADEIVRSSSAQPNVYPASNSVMDIAFHARLINMTTNTNVTNIIVNNSIPTSALIPGNVYRYIVETGLSQGAPFWVRPSNTAKLAADASNELGLTNDTFGNIIASPQNLKFNVFPFGDAFMQQIQNPATITPYSYYYEFTVSDSGALSLIPSGYGLDDVLVKTLNNIDTRLMSRQAPRFLSATSQAIYDSTPVGDRYEVTRLTTQLASTIIGNLNNYGIGARFKVNIVDSSNPTVILGSEYWGIFSEWEESAPPAFISTEDSTFQSSNYRLPKLPYTLDGDILSYVSNIPAPEFTFAGGKNLLEVLFEIGKSFNGIPRLKYIEATNEEVISFDILSKLEDLPAIGHEDSLKNKQSDADNYSTGLVTVIENAINDELEGISTSFYPNRFSWVKPKSKDTGDSIFNLDNMAINLENENNGIYKIQKVIVRNFAAPYALNGANYSTGLDISQQVVEKTIYNALEPSRARRGSFVYYERGKSVIDGLSYLPQKDEITGALGDRYAIQLAIQAAGYNLTNTDRDQYPISDYEFQIEYFPVVKKARIFSEQSKSTGETRKIYNAFSQPERNISLTQFGENAEMILRRTGVNSLQASYTITDPRELPFIGEILTDNGKKYYADLVSINYDNNSITAEVQYTRDTNKLDKFVGYSRNYREYEIYADDVVWKNKNINKYCYITYGPASENIIPNRVFSGGAQWRDAIMAMFNGSIGTSSKIDTAVLQLFDANGRKLKFTYENIESPQAVFDRVDNIALNVTTAYTNNSLIFISSMLDNFSAGNTLEGIPYLASNKFDFAAGINKFAQDLNANTPQESIVLQGVFRAIDNAIVVKDDNQDGFEDNRKRLRAVRYVDSFGRADFTRYRLGTSAQNWNTLSLPSFYSDTSLSSFNTSYMDDTLLIDKDNREALQFVTQLHFKVKDPRMTVFSPFMKYNRMIANNQYTPSQTLFQYTGKIITVGIEDYKKAVDEKKVVFSSSDILESNVTASVSGFQGLYTIFISSAFFTPNKNYEGFAFVFENTGELALGFEIPLTANQPSSRDIVYVQLSNTQRL